MNKELKVKTQQWMQMERRTLEQRKQAQEYYETNLMELIEKDYISRNKDKIFENVEHLVISVGMSYEPLTLNIQLLKPEKILFLCTEKSLSILEKVIRYCKLNVTGYEYRVVNETNPLDIYAEIKRIYLRWNRPDKMYIDFTGGTKAMSAAAAMAGAVISVQLVYVGTNDYLPDFRKPNPGSEELFFIENPLSVFGDMEIEKAVTLFAQYNYAGVREKLQVLKEALPDPAMRQQLNFIYLLAGTYEAWDALDFEKAYRRMSQLTMELKRDHKIHPDYVLMDFLPELQGQQLILEHLQQIPVMISQNRKSEILHKKDVITALMFTMYKDALVREEQEKYDMATLLFYRLLEMVEQKRLANYDLFVSQMDYDAIKYNRSRNADFLDLEGAERRKLLQDKVADIKEQIFSSNKNVYLQRQVSLLEGFIILLALNDPLMEGKTCGGVGGLKRIRAMVYLRNNSIFAHGLAPVKRDAYFKFRNFVVDVFREFCRAERISFDNYEEKMDWKDPVNSKYYSFGAGEESAG